ncbi:site-specific integrase [Gloeocapsopsis sp. IPPAS B-1203]|uniref:tyrosine-type recombinase/integrase n=1 Tax=Gloeocapsopsis sp. IPPAS B-1203 TaxID=2049454 RepID=UPI000C19344D|nr:site-specific integrase [Gloeocapsopsis sp. IPPAS B-1203]PIG94595.1 integrase [Gloeocapsopsis sp. IPPAS B-1203]
MLEQAATKPKRIKPINHNGSICIQFQLNNKTYKFNPIKGAKYSEPIALGKAIAIADQISLDLLNDVFDTSLSKYKQKNQLVAITTEKVNLTTTQLFSKYLEFKQIGLKESTIHYLKTSVYKYLEKCPYQALDEALEVRQWLLDNTTNSMTKRILTHLNAATKWGIKYNLISLQSSLYEGMAQELPKHNWEKEPKPNAFNQEEKEAIIKSFEQHKGNFNGRGVTGFGYCHYTALVKFLFFTGCRPSEAIGLTWGQIKHDCSQIIFSQSAVQLGNGKIIKSEGSKNSRYRNNRKFPCGSNLQNLLQSIRPESFEPSTLVFPSPKGKVINYANFSKTAWNKIVDSIVERETTPYSCRDTFMSEQVAKGVAPEIVARWTDSSADVIRKHYLDDKILEYLKPID